MKMTGRRPFEPLADECLEGDPAPTFESVPGARDFEPRFVRYLVAMLDRHDFHHLAFALMRSSADLAERHTGREEFDALVRLAIELLARQMPEHAENAPSGLTGGRARRTH